MAFILGFHVKNKIENFRFLPLSDKSHFQTYICWPVFSSVDRFVLKIERCFFTMRDIGIVTCTCTKISICLMRVLRNQYVERSAYANVFKFNRENAPTWRLHTEHYNFQ